LSSENKSAMDQHYQQENSGHYSQPQYSAAENYSDPVPQFNQLSINTQRSNPYQLEMQHQPSQVLCGPLLRYEKIDYDKRLWRGSCLIVSNDTRPPTLRVAVSDANNSSPGFTLDYYGTCLDSFRNQYQFWRFQLDIPLKEYDQIVTYSASCLDKQERYSFHLCAIQDSMRWVFHSCNGFSDIDQELKEKFGEKTAPLWADVLDRHEVMPFHILVGGGDQLYQDRMLKEEFMNPWLEEKDPKKRLAMNCLPPMRVSIEHRLCQRLHPELTMSQFRTVSKTFSSTIMSNALERKIAQWWPEPLQPYHQLICGTTM
jgi:hypothetical protein